MFRKGGKMARKVGECADKKRRKKILRRKRVSWGIGLLTRPVEMGYMGYGVKIKF